MSIWTNWDPLKEVIVGNCAVGHHSNKLAQILGETREDLDKLSDYLITLGVHVHRPSVTSFKESIDLGNFKVKNPTSPIVPRDQYLMYGNTIYQTYTSMPDRYLDSVNYYHIFKELFDRGYNWLSMPPPVLDSLVDKWWANGEYVYHEQLKDRILWHTATMFKCGDKLVTNIEGPGNKAGLDWMMRNLPQDTIVDAGNTHQKGFGHIDHGWFMTNDDLVFCVNKDWVPEPLRNKEIVELQDHFEKFDDTKFIADYQSTSGKYSDKWLDKWLTEWKGYAQEVFFDSNVLVIDSQNVLFSNHQPRIFKVMEKYGINCHVVPQRHGLFWEAGIHCLTLDLVRDGERRSIIS
jgi:glycine amidinotransferase/scyllo-inosamine-4-phosphate amidinotransferase 1